MLILVYRLRKNRICVYLGYLGEGRKSIVVFFCDQNKKGYYLYLTILYLDRYFEEIYICILGKDYENFGVKYRKYFQCLLVEELKNYDVCIQWDII